MDLLIVCTLGKVLRVAYRVLINAYEAGNSALWLRNAFAFLVAAISNGNRWSFLFFVLFTVFPRGSGGFRGLLIQQRCPPTPYPVPLCQTMIYCSCLARLLIFGRRTSHPYIKAPAGPASARVKIFLLNAILRAANFVISPPTWCRYQWRTFRYCSPSLGH